MKNTTHLIFGMLALTFGMEAMAQIQLPSVFSDGMVLQQNSKVAVWGWGNPSETLMILSEWNPGDFSPNGIRVTPCVRWSIIRDAGRQRCRPDVPEVRIHLK